jgi:hypothetical protein
MLNPPIISSEAYELASAPQMSTASPPQRPASPIDSGLQDQLLDEQTGETNYCKSVLAVRAGWNLCIWIEVVRTPSMFSVGELD